MIDGAPSRSACGHLSHLEVCKLLQCGVDVVYQEGLNGGLELLWVSLPKLPIWDSDSHTESAHEPALLQVNLPRIVPQWSSTPISSLHSVMEYPSDMVSCLSMTTEIQELLSITMPDNSEQPPTGISSKRPTLMAPIASREEIPLEAGKIDPVSLKGMPPSPQGSSQSGMADNMAHTSHTPSPSSLLGAPEETRVPSAPHLWASPRAILYTLPDEVLHLQEEMNNAMRCILTLQASLDTFPWSPEKLQQSFILPLVQEGGTEWGHCGEPPVHWSLPLRTHLQKIPTILHNQLQCNVTPCTRVWAHSSQWWQFRWWGARCQEWQGWEQTLVISSLPRSTLSKHLPKKCSLLHYFAIKVFLKPLNSHLCWQQ